MKFRIALAVFLVSATVLPNPPPVFAPPPAQVPSNFQSGGQYYDGSVSGLGDYMVELQKKDAKTYDALKGDLDTMRSERLWGILVPVGLLGSGIAMAAIGAGSSSSLSALMYTGIAFTVLAVPAYYLISPGRTDYLRFINKHNRLRPAEPLKLNIGMALTPTSVVAGLRMTF